MPHKLTSGFGNIATLGIRQYSMSFLVLEADK